jgi:uncharacterized protein YidB (DUF937 family)
MQQIGSPILEMMLIKGIRQRWGLLRTLRETWRGFRVGGIGGGLVGFVPSANGLAVALEAFRTDPASDPLLREILERLRRKDGVVDAVGDETFATLSSKTGLSPAAVQARLSKLLPAIAGAIDRTDTQ